MTGYHLPDKYYTSTMTTRQNGGQFSYDIFKYIFLNWNVLIFISLKFVSQGPVDNIPALV